MFYNIPIGIVTYNNGTFDSCCIQSLKYLPIKVLRIWGLSFIHNLNRTEFYQKPQNTDAYFDWLRVPAACINSQCISNLISPVLTVTEVFVILS